MNRECENIRHFLQNAPRLDTQSILTLQTQEWKGLGDPNHEGYFGKRNQAEKLIKMAHATPKNCDFLKIADSFFKGNFTDFPIAYVYPLKPSMPGKVVYTDEGSLHLPDDSKNPPILLRNILLLSSSEAISTWMQIKQQKQLPISDKKEIPWDELYETTDNNTVNSF